jgi:hypothetical protein
LDLHRWQASISSQSPPISSFDLLDEQRIAPVLILHGLDAPDVSNDDALHALLLRDDIWRKGDQGIDVT